MFSYSSGVRTSSMRRLTPPTSRPVIPTTCLTTTFLTSSKTCGANAPYSMSTEMFTRTELSGMTSTETPFVGSAAPKVSWTRLMKPPFMPRTPGTSRTAMATIFSMTPLEKVSESSESRSSSASEKVRPPSSEAASDVVLASSAGASVVSSTVSSVSGASTSGSCAMVGFVLMLAPIHRDFPAITGVTLSGRPSASSSGSG